MSPAHREGGVDEDDPLDTVRVLSGGDDGDEAAHRIADQRGIFVSEEMDHLGDEPCVVFHARSAVSGFRFTEADEVDCHRMTRLGEVGADDVPILG
jgi:hypothetical protein